MKRVMLLAALAAVLLVPTADATVLRTNWNERQGFANGKGFVRLYVRKIELARNQWKAWVGLTNASAARVTLTAKVHKNESNPAFAFWAGPGIWWTTRESSGNWWPDAGLSLTHSSKAGVVPGMPSALGPRKSWFGTFTGSLAKIPRDRLLRVGFGAIEFDTVNIDPVTKKPVRREMLLSTTHQFRLPR